MARPAPDQVQRIACVGGGYIGAGWAAAFLAAGKDVVMSDPGPDAEAKARVIIEQAWPYLEGLGLAPGASPDRFSFASSVEDAVAEVEFVQESAPDREDLKIKLFAQMDAAAPADTVLSSSSSAFIPTNLQSECSHPERVIIGHPFAPSYLIPLVEVVGGKQTDAEVLTWSHAFYEAVGKKSMTLKNEIEAYVANRIQHVVFEEAASLVAQGVCDYEDIDTAVAYGPGLRWAFAGPVTCYHLGGGKGGVRHMIDHFGWKRDEDAKNQLIGSVDNMYGHLSMDELERWRDENLMIMLKGLKPVPAKD
ncbi:MAG: 3-hydroxybutyryl-CoA dehydrogenase [Rhodospirillaceae bacterium]|nr:3-hydroxybutyryl-CoA dehydrogenase [Rhodospirillaceae bacterium]|tara:strand:- start:1827 stop:2744 length:918 start_codon:yes stop_codon:yes gene_type:complete